jgi:FtsH-binding integral membrane protein
MNISSLVQSSAGQYWSTFSRAASSSLAAWSGVILATSATALVGLGIYRWSKANQNQEDQVIKDRSFERIKEKIQRTYAYVFGGFALTAAAATASHVSGLSLKILTNTGYLLPIGLTVTSIGSLIATLATNKDDVKTKHVAWAIFNGTMGVMLSPLGFLNPVIIAQAAAISLGVGGLLTFTAFMAPDRQFLKWEGPLMTALTTLCVASTVAYFFPSTAFAYGVDRASLYGGLAIFSGLLMCSTHRLIDEAERKQYTFDPINSSLSIYLDTMNLFIRILRILVENRKDK